MKYVLEYFLLRFIMFFTKRGVKHRNAAYMEKYTT